MSHFPDQPTIRHTNQATKPTSASPTLLLSLVVVSTIFTAGAFYFFFCAAPHRTDFQARYNEGLAWRRGATLYQLNPSLNTHPPSVTLVLFAPLSTLPYQSAQWLTTGFNLLGVIASIRLIAGALGLTKPQLVACVALLFLTRGMQQQWALGQFLGLLMYPLTRAWIAYRVGHSWIAGVWLAPAIAMKPPLALLALLLPWQASLVAGVVSAAASAAAIPFTGLHPWREWIAAGSRVDWIARPFNASIWGVVARWQQGHTGDAMTLNDLAPPSVVIAVGAATFLAWLALRQRDRDRRFLLAGLWSILVSPLGWVYYLPLMVGPVAALWTRSSLIWIAYVLLQAPVESAWFDSGLLTGSLMCAGTICAWFALTASAPVPEQPLSGDAGAAMTRGIERSNRRARD